MLLALIFSLVVSVILGIVAYAVSRPDTLEVALRSGRASDFPSEASAEFIFFSIFGLLYLMWATVPLSIGGSKQFDAGKLLMYPITLRKLFAIDFISELTTLHSVFAVPAVLAVCIGAGLGSGNLVPALITAIPALLFGVALSKWLSTVVNSLVRRKRGKGETIVALIGAVAGLGIALAGQVAPFIFEHVESLGSLRWTPPGAAAFLLIGATDNQLAYGISFVTLSAYAIALIVATYWIARRAALGHEGRRRRKAIVERETAPAYSGWQLPLVPAEIAAVIEKELRYAMRNAQVRMMALMPLILIAFRAFNSRNFGEEATTPPSEFLAYGSGLLATGGILYVFLFLAGLSCNQFAFEEGGMRTLILSPVERHKILLGKNIALTVLAFVFSAVLLILNTVVFRDLTALNLLFIALSFIIFAAIMSMVGNWVSIRFPKRMRFGKRLNVSGVAGVLLIPLILLLSLPTLLATLVGYLSKNLFYEYVTLALFALVSVVLYSIVIKFQGRSLEQREIEILEVVREPSDE